MGTFEVGLNAFCTMIWLQAYGGQRVECDSLSKNGPCRPVESGTSRRYCILVMASVALLEKVCI